MPFTDSTVDELCETADKLLASASPSEKTVDDIVGLIERITSQKPSEGVRIGKAVTELAEKLGYRRGKSLGLGHTGYAYYSLSRHEEALKYFTRAEEIGQATDDPVAWGRLFGGMGMVHRSLGNLEKALSYGLRGLQILRETDHRLFEAWQLQGVGGIYSDMGDIQRAREFHEAGLKLFRSLRESPRPEWAESATVGEGRALSGLGSVCQAQGDLKCARDYHEAGLELFRQTGNLMGEARALNDIGEILAREDQLDRAYEYHKKALEIRRQISARQAQATSLLNLGRVCLLKQQTKEALEYLKQSLAIAEETSARQRIYHAHESLAEAYEKLGEPVLALKHHRSFHHVKEEVLGDRASSRLKNLQVSFEVEKSQREAEIERLRNVELHEKNEQLQQLLNELQAAQVQLIHSEKMASLGSLVAGVVHELNNPLGAMRSAVDTLSRAALRVRGLDGEVDSKADDPRRDQLEAALGAISRSSEVTVASMERIARVLARLKTFSHLDEADFQKVDLNREIEATLSLVKPEPSKRISFKTSFGDIPAISVYAGELNQVFMNLFTNAVQAIDGEGTISVETTSQNGFITVRISDTGRGMPREQLQSIFDPNFSRKGSRVKAGMGLFTSYNIIRKHGGDIEVESDPGQGTTFALRLPTTPK